MNQNNHEYTKQDLRRGVDYIGVTCSFFCHDGCGKLLLHKRSPQCRDEHGCWDSGAGAMEFGESFEDAVRREICEEYGVHPVELKFIDVKNILRDNNGTPTHWINVIFIVQVDPDEVRIGDPEKMDNLGWFLPDELPDPLHSTFAKHIGFIRKEIGI